MTKGRAIIRFALATTAFAVLAGCQTGGTSGAGGAPSATTATGDARSTRIVNRDVEAPEIFNVTAEALWDGRPSLGGVWVASDKATDPERVILRNPANGKFVIGALFRREAFNPGPPLQISSDAAAALGMMAGAPAPISVTALRREEVPVAGPDATAPIVDANEGVTTPALAAPAAATTAPTPAAGATAPAPAIPRAPQAAATAKPPAAAPAATTNPAAAAPAATTGGQRIQIGIFSVEANAKRAADTLTKAGISASVRQESAQGKTYWSVTASGSGGAALLDKVKGLGFRDAYFLRG
ncbi:MAG: hypothetical protein RIR62_1670 [Pseudomonadota bacterium]